MPRGWSNLFLGKTYLMQPNRCRIHAGRQRKPRVHPDSRILRLEVFLYKKFQNELGNLDAIKGDRIHVNEAFSLGAVGVSCNDYVMQSTENR